MATLVDQEYLISDSINCIFQIKMDSFISIFQMLHDFGKSSSIFQEYLEARIQEVSWELPTYKKLEFGKFSEVLSHLEANRLIDNASIKFPDRKCVFITYDFDSKLAQVDFTFGMDEFYKYSEALAFLNEASKISRGIFESYPKAFIEMKRNTVSHFAPEPPLAKAHVYLTTLRKTEVEEKYDNPKIFYNSWDKIEGSNGILLCTRALECAESLEFKRKVYPHQWAMARAAKPKLTKYFVPQPQPEEMDFFNEESSILEPVGYDPEKQLIEYSAVLEPGQHLPPKDVYIIRHLARRKETLEPEPRPVESVRVAFPTREMAEGEARVLLDVGAKVIYLNARAEDEEITD
jgi:hypothetical protein